LEEWVKKTCHIVSMIGQFSAIRMPMKKEKKFKIQPFDIYNFLYNFDFK